MGEQRIKRAAEKRAKRQGKKNGLFRGTMNSSMKRICAFIYTSTLKQCEQIYKNPSPLHDLKNSPKEKSDRTTTWS